MQAIKVLLGQFQELNVIYKENSSIGF